MRIDQHHSFLTDLLRHVQAGRMAPAAFQRPYVWSQQDVEALCDSVLNGFPLGGFLSWRPTIDTDLSSVAGTRLGPLPLARSTNDNPNLSPAPVDLLLDGQNRLASFAWMAAGPGHATDPSTLSEAERTTWCAGRTLTADALARTIRFMTDEEAQATLSVPAHLVVFPDSSALNRAVRQRMDAWEQRFGEAQSDAALAWLDQTTGAFREARVTHTVLVDATPEEARHAFLRICKVGVPMGQDDVDRAIGWTPPPTGAPGARTVPPADGPSTPGVDERNDLLDGSSPSAPLRRSRRQP